MNKIKKVKMVMTMKKIHTQSKAILPFQNLPEKEEKWLYKKVNLNQKIHYNLKKVILN